MPLYEYECKDCHTVTTKLINHSAPEEEKEFQECSHCSEMAHRIISRTNFELKGKWFKTTKGY